MPEKELNISAQHVLDRKLLIDDIVENLMLQEHGYKNSFIYAFNPNLKFRIHNSSDESQMKLLKHLLQMGILTHIKTPNYSNITDEFFSRNANEYSTKQVSIFISPKELNLFLDDFERSTLNKSLKSQGVTMDKGGYLHIPQISHKLISFVSTKDPKHLLQIILANKKSRQKSWKATELEPYLDKILTVDNPNMLVLNTVNNINRKIFKEIGYKKFLIAYRSNGILNVQVNDELM